jgi:hypothetical protein
MILSPHGRNHRAILDEAGFARLPAASDNYPELAFKDIYATVGIIGLRLGERAKELAGRPVRIRGYMSPHALDEANFFVLTRSPVLTCPFCDPGAAWPDDVVLALLERDSRFIDPERAIEVAGELDIGPKFDARTGALRLVRLRDARWHPLA